MGVVWGSFAAVFPDLKTMLGVDEAGMGLLIFLTPIAAVLSMLAAPALATLLGRAALPAATLSMALALALPGQSASLVLFPLTMMTLGAATGLTDVLMNARVAALENRQARPLMSLCHAVYCFGYAAAALTTGALRAHLLPPSVVLAVMALFALGIALMALERDGSVHGLARPKGVISAPLGLTPILGGIIVLIAFMTENASESWSALHIEQTLGGSAAEGAAGPASLALTMGLARLAGHRLSSTVAPTRLLQGGALLAGLGLIAVSLAPTPTMAYAGFIATGIGASVIAPTAFTLVGQRAAPEARARAIARTTLLGYFGYFIGPPLLGFVAAGFGLPVAFLFAALVVGVVLILGPALGRR
jgi:MFS family permease